MCMKIPLTAKISTRRSKGFTLIEIMVAIGIIIALTAILIPSLAKAKAHGRSTKCAANLYTIGQGCLMYMGDNDGWAAASYSDLSSYNSIIANRNEYKVESDKTLMCPEVAMRKDIYSLPMSYPMNSGCLITGQSGIIYSSSERRKYSEFRNPSGTWLAADGSQLMLNGKRIILSNSLTGGISPPFASTSPSAVIPVMRTYPLTGTTMSDPLFHGRHNKQGNVLWHDGHVSQLKPYLSDMWSDQFKETYNLGLLTPIPSTVKANEFVTRSYSEQNRYYLIR